MPIQECSEGNSKGFKWGDSGKCYLHDGTPEGIAAAKKKCLAQAQAMGEKLEDAAGLTQEYLQAFHDMVMAHPQVYKHVLAEVHLSARGKAGAARRWSQMTEEEAAALINAQDNPAVLEGPEKLNNAAYVDGDIIETDEYFDVPTVFAKEGVFTGTNGIPTLKKYEVLKANAPRFLGVPITDKHLETDTLRPTDRWLGHAISSIPRDDKRDIFGISRYYKSCLNPDETEKIRNKQFPDASPGYFTVTKSETGSFNGKTYNAVEEGPYNVVEYANFFNGVKGACSRAMGCGPYQNQAADELVLVDGNVKKCPKKLNGANKMSEDIEALKAEHEKQLNAANEKIATQEKAITALTKRLDDLEGSHKTLNESFEAKKTEEAKAKDAAFKSEFVKSLNAASLSEADALWGEVKDMNPMQYEAWKITNSAKLLDPREAKNPKGRKNLNAAGDAARNAYLEAHNKR